MLKSCRYTGVLFDAKQPTETTHPQLRSLLHVARQADIVGIVTKRLRIARDFGVGDIAVFVTFAACGDAAYLAAKIKGDGLLYDSCTPAQTVPA